MDDPSRQTAGKITLTCCRIHTDCALAGRKRRATSEPLSTKRRKTPTPSETGADTLLHVLEQHKRSVGRSTVKGFHLREGSRDTSIPAIFDPKDSANTRFTQTIRVLSAFFRKFNHLRNTNSAFLHSEVLIYPESHDTTGRENYVNELQYILHQQTCKDLWRLYVVFYMKRFVLMAYNASVGDLASFSEYNDNNPDILNFLRDHVNILSRPQMRDTMPAYAAFHTKCETNFRKNVARIWKAVPKVEGDFTCTIGGILNALHEKSVAGDQPMGKPGGGSFYSFVANLTQEDVREFQEKCISLASHFLCEVQSLLPAFVSFYSHSFFAAARAVRQECDHAPNQRHERTGFFTEQE